MLTFMNGLAEYYSSPVKLNNTHQAGLNNSIKIFLNKHRVLDCLFGIFLYYLLLYKVSLVSMSEKTSSYEIISIYILKFHQHLLNSYYVLSITPDTKSELLIQEKNKRR